MANIKFSDFTVGNTEGDIDFVVGYKGASNIQISPTNLLASALGNYLPLAGGTMTGDLKIIDNIQLQMGNGLDFRLYHDATNSIMSSGTGDLYIQNTADDKDIIFRSDNGAGGLSAYITLDGNNVRTQIDREMRFMDTIPAKFGTGGDLQISHDATDSYIQNATGNLKIFQNANDKDITFYNDDGSGGTTAYFFLDGSLASSGTVYTVFPDNSRATFGSGADLEIYHNATDSAIQNNTGDLYISNFQDDGDIIFRSDNGSGGHTQYFRVDGGDVRTIVSKPFRFNDGIAAEFGTGLDMQLYHSGGEGTIQNLVGNLRIIQSLDDGDIQFFSDDGSGGTTEYFRVDGGTERVESSKSFRFADGARAQFGASSDLQIYHDGSNSIIQNSLGDLRIQTNLSDGDIVFKSDNGSGGMTEYFRVDGSEERNLVSKNMDFLDNVKLRLGTGSGPGLQDLQIYHDGSNSYIKDTGTGHLNILGSNIQFLNTAGNKYYATFADGAQVKLFYNGVEKIETTITGVKISGVSEYADNTAAISGGLTAGDVYRTGDLLKIVH